MKKGSKVLQLYIIYKCTVRCYLLLHILSSYDVFPSFHEVLLYHPGQCAAYPEMNRTEVT